MSKRTREQELAAKLAEMQRQNDALQKQLAAQQSGSGAVAQDGGIAAGKRGVAAKKIKGDVLTGDQARKIKAGTYIEKQTNQQLVADPTQADPDALRTAYLTYLIEKQVGSLDLVGVGPNAVDSDAEARLRLDAVYTALLTTQPEWRERAAPQEQMMVAERKAEQVSAITELNRHRRLVLLGDPGSGKSTFVNFVALCLAGAILQQTTGQRAPADLKLLTAPLPTAEGEEGAEVQPWDHGALLPVRIVLREFAARGLPPAGEPATADHLWTYIGSELHRAGLADYRAFLRKTLLEQGGLILLDGLDEVPDAEQQRTQIKQVIETFAAPLSRCRILVTSRTYAYQTPAWRLDDFVVVQLAPFSDGQIRRFVERWYAYNAEQRGLPVEETAGRAVLLKHAIFASDRLRALAERPLLLTLMASLHAWRGGNLPERREELYAEAVDLLLDRWEKQRVKRNAAGEISEIIQPSLAEYLKVDRQELQTVLNRLAFQVHANQAELVGVANIDELDLVAALWAISRNAHADPVQLVDYLSQRSGLLLAHGKVYTFPHRTFQEYLAACYLTDDDYPDQVVELACHDPNRWREVALLAGAKAARGTASALWSLVDALCYQEPNGWEEAESWGAHLAGQALVETVNLAQVNKRTQEKVARVRRGLVHVMGKSNLPALERAHAGRNLAKLGDPRPEVLTVEAMHFCAVPAGPFAIGDGNEQHTNSHLDYEYWLARYPVTNAQFQQFMAAGGYATKAYWPEAIAARFWQQGKFKGRYDDEARNHPYDFGEPFHLPNHPVVGVSWYEALAFTRWLTDYLRDQLPPGWRITLPSEAEWEKAARGGEMVPVQSQPFALSAPNHNAHQLKTNPKPTRVYPWTNDSSVTEQANCKGSNIAATSAVGCFAGGASPYGVEELAGNVWEWTRTLWGYDHPYNPTDGRENLATEDNVGRVLRGGSYYSEAGAVGCGARDGYGPYSWYSVYGFRIVASPLPLGSE
jgi:formylglycine-generating enzyme required for sulfatase activity